MPDAIPKAVLDAETDQALALFRDKRRGLTDDAGQVITAFAESIAGQLRAQFPGTPGLGRIVMAISQQIGCADQALQEIGARVPAITLLTIAGLAAEELEREP